MRYKVKRRVMKSRRVQGRHTINAWGYPRFRRNMKRRRKR